MDNDVLDLWAFDFGTVKSLDDEGRFEGLCIPFGDCDLSQERDRFDAQTEFGRSLKGGADLLYYHGLPKIGGEANPLAGTIIGEAEFSIKTECDPADAGVWAKGQMTRRNAYEIKVWEMVKAKKLGMSTGSAPHRTCRSKNADGSNTMKTWPIVELSFTPTPAHPRTKAFAIKSLLIADDSPESVGFVESLARAESALKWAIGRELNVTKSDALKTLAESVQRFRDSRIDPVKLKASIATCDRLLSAFPSN